MKKNTLCAKKKCYKKTFKFFKIFVFLCYLVFIIYKLIRYCLKVF